MARRVVNVRFVPHKRSGFMVITRCRDREACRGRWTEQGKGNWPLVEADLPAPHWMSEVAL